MRWFDRSESQRGVTGCRCLDSEGAQMTVASVSTIAMVDRTRLTTGLY
jgi:hypothetical protein